MREPYSNRETRITMEPFKCEQCGWASATGKAECPYCEGEKAARSAIEQPQKGAETPTCHRCGSVETSASECHACGGKIDPETAECEQCGWTSVSALRAIEAREEQEALEAEERRRGVVDTEEPTWQRQVLVLLDEALPVLYQAVLLCRDRELVGELFGYLQGMRQLQIMLEIGE